MKRPVFVLTPDSFKGSLTALQVCDAMEKGIRNVLPNAQCIKVPMADGGEGTVQSLVDATGGKIYELEVIGPLGNPVMANYGILGDGETAVIEMASASGIQYVNKETANPFITTTYGTGELVKACLEKGIKKIILGIGGSATNDGGAGFAQALGVRFLDKNGRELPFGGGALKDLYTIDTSFIDQRLKDVKIGVACDVTNHLCGVEGASYIFGPQKGATPEMAIDLDNALKHYAEIIKNQLGKDVKDVPGAGAAGGLGAGLLAFTNASLRQGFEIIAEYTGLQEKIKKADIVFTGEGSIDSQTQYGKTPYGIAQLAKAEHKTVIAIAGNIGSDIGGLHKLGFDAVFSIIPGITTMEKSIEEACDNVERTIENIVRTLVIGAGLKE